MKHLLHRLAQLGGMFMLCAAVVLSSAVADQAQYIYDDLGRLSQVIDGQGNVATYNYDAVGNLLSITRNTGGVGAPTITGLTPNIGNAGASVNVTLAGTNLTGAALGTDNPGILVRNVVTTPTSIAATFQMSFAARTGATAVTVTTASIHRLPDQLFLRPSHEISLYLTRKWQLPDA